LRPNFAKVVSAPHRLHHVNPRQRFFTRARSRRPGRAMRRSAPLLDAYEGHQEFKCSKLRLYAARSHLSNLTAPAAHAGNSGPGYFESIGNSFILAHQPGYEFFMGKPN
jgi:hypothetical protein